MLPDAKGRPWSKVPLIAGWERVISGNSCPKGLLEDVNEMRVVKAQLEEVKRVYPNIAETLRKDAFRPHRGPLCDWCTFKAYCPAWGGDPERVTELVTGTYQEHLPVG